MAFYRVRVLAALIAGFVAFGAGYIEGTPNFGDGAYAQSKKKKRVVRKAKAPPAPPPAAGDPAKKDNADLVLLASETVVEFGGCGTEDLLLSGTVAIKNQGKGRETTLTQPLIATFLPENLDMLDSDIVVNSLKQNEIVTKDITIGKGKIKDFRRLNGTRKVYIMVDPYNAVDESNENNNLIVREIKMNCK